MNDTVLLPLIASLLAFYVLVVIAEQACKLYWRYNQSAWRKFGLDSPASECPNCGEVAMRAFGVVTPRKGNVFVEYECTECSHYETV